MALRATQLWSRPEGTAGRGCARALRAPQPPSLATFLPGCVAAARSAEARLPVATTRRRFAAGDAAVAAGTAAASRTSGSSICNSGGGPLTPAPGAPRDPQPPRRSQLPGLALPPTADNRGAGSARCAPSKAPEPPREGCFAQSLPQVPSSPP